MVQYGAVGEPVRPQHVRVSLQKERERERELIDVPLQRERVPLAPLRVALQRENTISPISFSARERERERERELIGVPHQYVTRMHVLRTFSPRLNYNICIIFSATACGGGDMLSSVRRCSCAYTSHAFAAPTMRPTSLSPDRRSVGESISSPTSFSSLQY